MAWSLWATAESSTRRMSCSGEVPTLMGVSRLWLLALGSAAVAAAEVLVARANGDSAGLLEWAFSSALLFALAVAIRLVVTEGLAAAAARNRSRRLRETQAAELARQAVVEECSSRRRSTAVARNHQSSLRGAIQRRGLGRRANGEVGPKRPAVAGSDVSSTSSSRDGPSAVRL